MMPANAKIKERKQAVKWLLKGKTAKWCADKVGVHPTTVQRWAHEEGIELEYPYNAHQNRTDLVDKHLILELSDEMFEGKPLYTRKEVAEICECSESYVKIIRRKRKDGLL
jgi:transposase